MIDHERRLYLAAHPVAYPLLRLLARLGPVVRVPGLGVVVNDAATARAVLMDERFRKDGPGSPGDLWTPVLGPSVLLNMEGPAHLALRRKLAPLFAPAYVAGLVEDVLRAPLKELDERLARGDRVDLVDAMRLMAGAVICRVIGLGEVPEARARELFADGERVVAMVSLRSRGLSPRQIAVAREVLDRIGDIAAAAYAEGDETTVMGRMRALGLSEAEARGAAGAFFLTGTETVATFVPRLVALIHDHGTRVTDLDAAIEDAMRVTTPTPVMLRSVAEPARIGRARVRPGDRVIIATHNCARAYGPFDPDAARPPEVRRLWFGAGPHFCIGYPLALAEIRAVASVVLAHRPRVVARRAARGVLIPTYRNLWITAS
ncbi:cytochrome P450 [Thermocatellispora tengchongensis]|uniref:Cytochrome P450 n=1 Tax=Thermocatellispora tengchongensis TaxID=1073253 RepID=A0A840NU89_9ACTN|nr:cytochrome P450 [Thermocatellispora tengchongensis]MBB5130379.1 cytochrome P450 [Thermocatellispora tengchongensis]